MQCADGSASRKSGTLSGCFPMRKQLLPVVIAAFALKLSKFFAQPMIVAFAQQLRDAREPIVQRWMAAVRADPKLITANGLAEQELRDHLGSLVLRLAETL